MENYIDDFGWFFDRRLQYSQKKLCTKVDKMIRLIRFEMDFMVGSRRKQEYV